MKINIKKILAVLPLLVLLLCSCGKDAEVPADTLKAGILTSDGNGTSYKQLKNSMIATLEVSVIPPENADFSEYDMIFIEASAPSYNAFEKDKIQEYVNNGGFVFLDNSLYNSFDKDFIGASEFKKIDTCPTELDCPDDGGDMLKIQELLCDFINLYKEYDNYDILSQKDYGYGVIPANAQNVASFNGVSLYTLNKYGNGYVFFSNPLLPNVFSVNDLTPDDSGEYLSSTTVGANILLRSMFAEFVSIKKYGYAVWRTFGSFGTKPASWELHYEDITGIENESAIKFDELCRKYNQFPSYTLARNVYVWFERAESVTYLTEENGSYEMDAYENAYSSGKHFVTSGKWLQLDHYEDTESYFKYDSKYTKRAYPCIVDFDADGKTDLIAGSADGMFYFYSGTGMNTNYELGPKTLLTDKDGNPLSVGAYSSPALADIDCDGVDEIVSGSEDGGIYCFKRIEGCAFEDQGKILDTGLVDSMVDAGDLNGDGLVDLAVGARNGELRIYYGEKSKYGVKFEKYKTIDSGQSWCAPCITEENELYIGTNEGYVVKFKSADNGRFVFDKYIDGTQMNYAGNKHLKFGENCVPRFYDIDKDGKTELIAGQLEYGMAYPIDSEYFPYRDKLQKQVDYFKENYIYLGVHSLTNRHAGRQYEKNELDMQKKAFESYGIEWDGKGANQHTWYTSQRGYDENYDNEQGYAGTYRSQFNSGLLWNSGSQTPNSNAVPQISAENSINIPFYLFDKMLMLEPSNTPYGNEKYSEISTKYEVPLLFYHHCDYIYEDIEEQEERVKAVDDIVTKNGYCFVGEDQLVKAVAAAYNTKVYSRRIGDKIVIESETIDKKLPLYDKKYAGCTGVKVVFAPGEDVTKYSSDASVWRVDNHGVYVSLDKEAVISKEKNDEPHIRAVNIPAKIQTNDNETIVKFKENGFMQVFIDGEVSTQSEGWKTVNTDSGTMFIKYGKASELVIKK